MFATLLLTLPSAAAATPKPAPPPAISVLITEFMASNSATLSDEDGDSSDWLELHNPTGSTVDLTGWYLTDDVGVKTKWTFPAVSLPADGYLVVFASGKDKTTSELHTNFSLKASGEYLALVEPDGTTIAWQYSPEFPEQNTDVSYGLDATLQEVYFATPTPGAPNGGSLIADTVFSVDRGLYDAPFDVTITTLPPGANIMYTLDGSVPTTTHGIPYTGPVTISTTTVLRAIGWLPDSLPSNVDTQTYIFVEDVIQQPANIPGYPNPSYDVGSGSSTVVHDYEMDPDVVNDPAYSTDVRKGLRAIPTMSVAVDPALIFGPTGFYDSDDVEHACSIEILYPDGKDEQSNAGIEGHSHTRLKRSLRLNFRSIYGDPKLKSNLMEKAPLNGDTAVDDFDRLVLRAGNNRSWARNWNPDKTAYTLDEFYRGSQLALGDFGSRGAFVHLYINGLYWGLYNAIERPDDKWQDSYFDGDDDDWFAINHGGPLTGDAARWNHLTGALEGLDMSVPANYAQLEQYLDVEAFCDYLIMTWWTGTGDWPGNNWYGGNRNASSPLGVTPHRFYAWDGEWSWDAPWGFNNPGNRAHVHPDFRASKGPNGLDIVDLWHAARANDEFMMTFADRVHRAVAGHGPLSDDASRARWHLLNTVIEDAVVAESARWGDSLESLGFPLRTRDGDWQSQVDKIDGLMDGNADVFIAAVRAQGFYPTIDAPGFGQHGGVYFPGFELSMSDPSATGMIWYTLDGSDPRLEGGTVSPTALLYGVPFALPGDVTVNARAQKASGEWSALTSASFTFCAHPPVLYGSGVNPPGSIAFVDGCPQLGDTITFALDNPLGTQPPGTSVRMAWSIFPDPNFPAGTLLPGTGMAGPGALGELLLSTAPPILPLLKAPDWFASGTPVMFTLPIVNLVDLVGVFLFFQGVFIDFQGMGIVPVGFTEAYAVQIGA